MSSLYTRLKITLGSANADSDALTALRSDEHVRVTEGKNIEFAPATRAATTGVILYPGGRCDSRAYAPLARPLAAAGYHVFVPQMPLRLAVLDANRAGQIIADHANFTKWVLGGHSMGGAMAAAYVFKHPGTAAGLFFTASYPSGMHAMPDTELPVIMIYGTRDEVTRKSEFEASYERLPQHTDFVAVEGGDHYQFGSFANVEVTATISREEQQEQTVASLLTFLHEV